MYRFGPASYILIFSAMASLGTMVLAWQRRQELGGRFLVASTFFHAVWAVSTAFEYAAPDVPGKLLWSQIQYLGVTTSPVLHMLFGLAYGRQRDTTSRRMLLWLFVIPAITLLLAATNASHGLIWRDIVIQPDTNLALYDHGPAFWVFFSYAYGALAIGTVSFVYGLVHASSHYRAQMLAVLAAALLPVLGNLAYHFRLGPWPGLDWTPVSFGISAAFLALSIDRFRLLDLMPVMRTEMLDMMSEGVLATDEQGRIVDANAAMSDLLRRVTTLQLGKSASEQLAPLPELVAALEQPQDQRLTLHLMDMEGEHWYDARVSSVSLPRRTHAGHLVVVRDITTRHHLASERDGLIRELEDALAEVSTLSGLIPMCPHCKNVRDDLGYWHSVEAYVSEQSRAQFSHGICPECMYELYPDLYPRPKPIDPA